VKRIVLDTNILLVSISQKSSHHVVFASLLQGAYVLCFTTEILNEYAEIVEKHMGAAASEAVLETLTALPNVELITTYFRFRLMPDEDDDKFVDCAVAANATFRFLKKVDFPKIEVLRLDAFEQKLISKTL
jgi:uncharacterized protein